MDRRLRHVARAAVALFFLVPASGSAQYMFLDMNGDGQSTKADTLGNSGTFNVSVWLMTDKDRTGASARCAAGDDLTVNSYELVLRSEGGSVRWDDYENAQVGMTVPLGRRTAGSDFYCGYAGSEALAPGTYRLGAVRLTVTSGSPSIAIVPDSPLGATLHTSFGSACPSADGDHTMELGTDWFDVAGVSAGTGHGGEQTPSITVDGRGHLFVGGNEIAGPWTLSKVRGVVTANGLVFPPAAVIPPSLSDEALTERQFLDRAGALMDSLNRAGVEPPVGVRYLAQFCSSNTVGARVEERGNNVVLRLRDGTKIALKIGLTDMPVQYSAPVSRKELDYSQLQQAAQFLRSGCIVFIVDRATTVVIPSSRRNEALSAVYKLRAGTALSSGEMQVLPAPVQAQIRSPIALVRVGEEVNK